MEATLKRACDFQNKTKCVKISHWCPTRCWTEHAAGVRLTYAVHMGQTGARSGTHLVYLERKCYNCVVEKQRIQRNSRHELLG